MSSQFRNLSVLRIEWPCFSLAAEFLYSIVGFVNSVPVTARTDWDSELGPLVTKTGGSALVANTRGDEWEESNGLVRGINWVGRLAQWLARLVYTE